MSFVQTTPLTEEDKQVRAELKRIDGLRKKQETIKHNAQTELDKLTEQFIAIQSKCPHAAEDMDEGWMYDVCLLCGELF